MALLVWRLSSRPPCLPLENRVERVYREAVADLFANPRDVEHVVGMLKLREIYRHLSNAADRGDQAANAIADVVVKRT